MSEFLSPPGVNLDVSGRIPQGVDDTLRNLWKKHFSTSGAYNINTGGNFRLHRSFFSEYDAKAPQIVLALEHLYQVGTIPNSPQLFDSAGRMHRDLSVETVEDSLLNKRLLDGVEILVIGGPEGRVFAEMGATVVSFDPLLEEVPTLQLPNLKEVADIFGPWEIQNYVNRFDLTMSCRLFDDGSGLVSLQAYRGRRTRGVYGATLGALLEVTRAEGIGIHDGGTISLAIADNADFCKVREIAAPHYLANSESSFFMHVVQKNVNRAATESNFFEAKN